MSLALNKPKLDNLASDIWKSAERLRGKFHGYEYQGVILPIIVIRRLECVLIDWRQKKAAEVLARRPKLTEKELAKLVKELELNPKQSPFATLTAYRKSLIHECVTGQRRITEADVRKAGRCAPVSRSLDSAKMS
jgi:type I restriction enzyme M protein